MSKKKNSAVAEKDVDNILVPGEIAEASSEKKKKRRRRFGDRKDGRKVRSIDPMFRIMPYIMAKRSDAQNTYADSFDIIRRTTSFDIGRIFTEVLSADFGIADEWSSCVAKSQKWATKGTMMKRMFEAGVLTASRDLWALKDTLYPTPKS